MVFARPTASRKPMRGNHLGRNEFSPADRQTYRVKNPAAQGWRLTLLCLLLSCAIATCGWAADEAGQPTVAQRRERTHIICHRGASEFAHENTLEAYRATFELGADGNEIDIRSTKDGVLVCFHDDMLDRILAAYGDVSDYTWAELQTFQYRNPGRFGDQCRIPTLKEVFELHRKYNGLMHLDIKRPNLDGAIIKLLDEIDLWENVGYCNSTTGGAILTHTKYKPCRYKGGLYLDRSEVFPDAITALLEKLGEGVIVDDPRGTILALGRKLGKASSAPVSLRTPPVVRHLERGEAELMALLNDDADWDDVAQSPEEQLASGRRIVARARAADDLLSLQTKSKAALAALEQRVRHRSLHKQWMYQGLDGEKALRALILLRAPKAVELSRFVLWNDDPALEPVVNPEFKNPRSWTDFRVKTAVFPALAHFPGAASEKLCRDYLAQGDEEATKLGPLQFEQAGHALLSISPSPETVAELMKHRLQVVRGRAVLDCLAHGKDAWAKEALQASAPHALAYLVD